MEEKKGLQIELTPEVAEGIYSNLAIISHSSSEFVIDFARTMPRVLLALQDNLAAYEQQHGTRLDPRGGFIPYVGPGGKA